MTNPWHRDHVRADRRPAGPTAGGTPALVLVFDRSIWNSPRGLADHRFHRPHEITTTVDRPVRIEPNRFVGGIDHRLGRLGQGADRGHRQSSVSCAVNGESSTVCFRDYLANDINYVGLLGGLAHVVTKSRAQVLSLPRSNEPVPPIYLIRAINGSFAAGGAALLTAKEATCFPETAFGFVRLPSARLSALSEVRRVHGDPGGVFIATREPSEIPRNFRPRVARTDDGARRPVETAVSE